MLNLLKSEWLRFRFWAAGFGLVHVLALGFMARVVDLAQQPLLVHWVIGGLYALAGFLFGLYQIGSYRKPSQWLNLLHRPLPPTKIAAALFGAAGVALLVAVALPLLVIALYQANLTPRVVDVRHWLLPWAAWGVAACAYLAGVFASLRGKHYGGESIVLLAGIIASQAYGFGLIAVMCLIGAWLAMLAFEAFKPDLTAPPRDLVVTLAQALPLSAAAFGLMALLMLAIEMLWIAQGSHPNNTPTPPANGINEVKKAAPRERMLAALRNSTHPDAPLLREQIRMSEPMGIEVQMPKQPQRNELANFRPMEFDDSLNKVRWVFSHDDMRFHGYGLETPRAAGTFGIGANNAAFPSVVLPAGGLAGKAEGDAVLVGGHCLYQFVAETRHALRRLCARRGETLLGAGPVGESLVALSDRALYFFDGRPLVEHHQLIPPRSRTPLPGKTGDLLAVDLIELVDGYLVTLTYGRRSHSPDGSRALQTTLRQMENRPAETLAVRHLDADYPLLWRYRNFWPSPALYHGLQAARTLFAPTLPLDSTAPVPVPRGIWMFAALLSILAAALAWHRALQARLPATQAALWIGLNLLLSLPACAAMYWRVRPQALD